MTYNVVQRRGNLRNSDVLESHLSFLRDMEEIPKRNVHVFNASNGYEVAGTFTGLALPSFSSNQLATGFFQHGGVSISTFVGWINEIALIPEAWRLYPSQFNNNRAVGGPAFDSNSAAEIPPGRYVIRTLPPGT